MRSVMVVLACLAAVARADDRRYAMPELEALDQQQAWDELARHLDDIPPTQRGARWQVIVEHTALGILAARAADPAAAMTAADGFTRRHPSLKRSRDFMARRAEVGLAALARCVQRDDTACAARFLDFVDTDPANHALALRAGLAIAPGTKPAIAVPFLRRGLAARAGAKECADPMVARAVHQALLLPADDPRVADATAIAAKLCWDALAEGLVTQFASAGDGYRRNTCGFLADKQALSRLSLAICRRLKP